MNNVIIDLEFTGLDNTYKTDNEIVQVKLCDTETRQCLSRDFYTDKPVSLYHTVFDRVEKYKGKEKFSEESIPEMLAELGVSGGIKYWGYSVSQDVLMLSKYGYDFEITDLQELIRLNPEYEKQMTDCASMEAAYYLLTGDVPKIKSHFDLGEIVGIAKIYQIVKTFANCNQLLTLMPWGHCAGMPIKDYVRDYRKAADGYRYNNDDLLSKSLTAAIPQYIPDDDDDDECPDCFLPYWECCCDDDDD